MEAMAFLADSAAISASHLNAYAALIDGLVADGLWDNFDVLRIYANGASIIIKERQPSVV